MFLGLTGDISLVNGKRASLGIDPTHLIYLSIFVLEYKTVDFCVEQLSLSIKSWTPQNTKVWIYNDRFTIDEMVREEEVKIKW